MNKKVLLTALLTVAIVLGVSAQKFNPAPDVLKGQTEINIVFDYSKVVYDKDSQQKHYKKQNQSWIEEWEGKRRDANAEGFTKDINEELANLNVTVGNFPNAPYTMIVDVINCDFGAYAGPMSVPAKLICVIHIVKTGTKTPLSTTDEVKVKQNPYTTMATPVDFDRMYLAFTEMGEKIGEKLASILKKK